MADLIDRAALLAAGDATKMTVVFEDWDRLDLKTQRHILRYAGAFKRLVKAAPTIDAEPVKHGQWIKKYDYCDDEYWTCSACNEQFYFEFPPIKFDLKYCSNCGAKMDGGKRTDEKTV